MRLKCSPLFFINYYRRRRRHEPYVRISLSISLFLAEIYTKFTKSLVDDSVAEKERTRVIGLAMKNQRQKARNRTIHDFMQKKTFVVSDQKHAARFHATTLR